MFRRRRSVQDFAAELDAHLALEADRLREEGLPDDEARAAARRAFGNVTRTAERFYESGRWHWWDHLRQDVRSAIRLMRTAPGFTATVVVIMAIGIGATTAIFGVMSATLLKPLPYPEAEQLVSIEDDLAGLGARDVGMSQPEWQDLQRSGIFTDVSPTWFDENNLTGGSRPERVRILITAPNYFDLLRAAPQLGRTFDARDHSPGILPEIVISDSLWKRSFGGDPHVLGRTMRLDTDAYRIIGVMPPGFDAPGRMAEERDIEVWVPTSFYGAPISDHPPRSGRNLPTAIARVKSGVSIAAAQRQVDALTAALRQQYPADYPARTDWRVRLLPLKERIVGDVRPSLTLLFAAVALVLLIGCVNVANLLLARAGARAREMAVRQALGAVRSRLVRQLLTESLLLSLLGGAAGVAMLLVGKNLLLGLVPASLPRLNAIAVSPGVLTFALIVALATGVVFGIVPALQVNRVNLTRALKEVGRSATGSRAQARTRRLLVVGEFAISLVLLVSAALLLRSFWGLVNARLGFDPKGVMTVRTRLPYPNHQEIDRYPTAAREAPFLREVLRRVRALPGVHQVAIGDTASIPLDPNHSELVIAEGAFIVTIEGRDSDRGELAPALDRTSVTPEYFDLLGVRLLRGRTFSEFDTDTTPRVAVVNEAFARKFWPGEDAVGKRFRNNRAGAPWNTVVGIMADAKTQSLADTAAPVAYLDLYQTGSKHLAVLLRGQLDPAAIPDEVRAAVQSIDPGLPVFDAKMLDDTVSASLAERRLSLELLGLFALTALLLAALGIYGVTSFIVNERAREIGIRLALGADRRGIVRGILREGSSLALAGAAAGLACALVAARVMARYLYNISPMDAATFLGVSAVLTAIAAAACYLPARRAARMDPIAVLRSE